MGKSRKKSQTLGKFSGVVGAGKKFDVVYVAARGAYEGVCGQHLVVMSLLQFGIRAYG